MLGRTGPAGEASLKLLPAREGGDDERVGDASVLQHAADLVAAKFLDGDVLAGIEFRFSDSPAAAREERPAFIRLNRGIRVDEAQILPLAGLVTRFLEELSPRSRQRIGVGAIDC